MSQRGAPEEPPAPLTGLRGTLGRPTLLEGRARWELATLKRHPIWDGEGVPPGEGRAVLLIPGFFAGERSMAAVREWLERCGYAPRRAHLGRNTAPSEHAVRRLSEELDGLASERGPVAVIGHSRGGQLGRALAVRRPDAMGLLATLGAPLRTMYPPHLFFSASLLVFRAIGRVRRVDIERIREGEAGFEADLLGPFPEGVPFVSIWSRLDGFIDWRSSLDPAARSVEVNVSHLGLSGSVASFRAIADALVELSGPAPAAPA